MMSDMMKQCCGDDGKSDFDRMKEMMKKSGCRFPEYANAE